MKRLKESFSTLKFRLMVLITVVLIVVVGIPVGFFVYQLDRSYTDFSVNMIETTSQMVYQFLYDGMMKNDTLMIQKNLNLMGMEPNIQLIRIYAPNGRILYSTRPQELRKNISQISPDFAFINEPGKEMEAFIQKGDIFSHHHPIYFQPECGACHTNVGKLAAVLDIHTGFTQSHFLYATSKRLVIFGGILIILILWILLNLLYQSQIESRLRTIIAAFNRLADGDLDVKIQFQGRHELARLGDRFNQMVSRLRAAREKEEQLFEERLQRADRLVTLGEIAAEIAHEVNNPAGIILSRTEYLKEIMEEQDPDSVCLEDLNMVIQQTEKIARTTRSILHYARKLPQKFQLTDLNEVIRHSIKVLEPRIHKRRVRINIRPRPRPAYIVADFSQLEQVFCNLINNSLDVIAMDHGEILITVDEQDTTSRGKRFRVIFQDNGPGIPADKREVVFSPFFTTKGQEKGTGLGLFIVRNIINHHGGRIWIDSHFQDGARFIIELEESHGDTPDSGN